MITMLCGVNGIQNKESKTQIKNALNKIDGVNAVGVNLATSTIEIQYNEPATENDIKNCIENAGFKIIYE
ncbi:MAG: heavy-metal-associated domain-containing protein [Oscillospiraceae bacterium]